MTYIPEPDPTPLRLRLGTRAESFWQQSDVTPEIADALADSLEYQGAGADADYVAAEETPRAPNLRTQDADAPVTAPARAAWSEGLDRAVAQTDRRVDQWLADQQSRLVAGLDLMLAQLKEQRRAEAARLEAWTIEERERVQRTLAEEEERFRERLMNELTAFEEQLALRLYEQEERLARWWDQAEQVAQARFADLGLSATGVTVKPD
ncbi:MAG: hypothetical protein E6J09_03130 [Chloroflexi bacterium]|nr:MAG: hypothetical protein E6J09_03130 [Chloroflexota bacterium]